jgi:hypothetical protein
MSQDGRYLLLALVFTDFTYALRKWTSKKKRKTNSKSSSFSECVTAIPNSKKVIYSLNFLLLTFHLLFLIKWRSRPSIVSNIKHTVRACPTRSKTTFLPQNDRPSCTPIQQENYHSIHKMQQPQSFCQTWTTSTRSHHVSRWTAPSHLTQICQLGKHC